MVQQGLLDQLGRAVQLDHVNQCRLHPHYPLQILEDQVFQILLQGLYHQEDQEYQGHLCLPVIPVALSNQVIQSVLQYLQVQVVLEVLLVL